MFLDAVESSGVRQQEQHEASRGRSPVGPGRKGQRAVMKGNAARLAKTMASGRNVKDYTAVTEKR